MAKRKNGPARAERATATPAAGATPPDVMEQRMVAFAEQLGRMVGTIQARAEGWMDRATLNEQLASVRDGAARLIEQLAGASTTATTNNAAPAAGGARKARSGGVVDAPGKRHRKRAPADPHASLADSQAAKRRTAMTMVKTNRRRGRG